MLRAEVERVSRPLLVRLSSLPKLALPIVTVALMAIGVIAAWPIAFTALGILLVFMIWIAYLSWPAVTASGKFLRVLMILLILGLVGLHFIR